MFLLNITVGVTCFNSALDSEMDLPFCEQQKCDQETFNIITVASV